MELTLGSGTMHSAHRVTHGGRHHPRRIHGCRLGNSVPPCCSSACCTDPIGFRRVRSPPPALRETLSATHRAPRRVLGAPLRRGLIAGYAGFDRPCRSSTRLGRGRDERRAARPAATNRRPWRSHRRRRRGGSGDRCSRARAETRRDGNGRFRLVRAAPPPSHRPSAPPFTSQRSVLNRSRQYAPPTVSATRVSHRLARRAHGTSRAPGPPRLRRVRSRCRSAGGPPQPTGR
jgi:hypothetical protein